MTARLIVARHGNTFESSETPRRVGRRTDLPLTPAGREQASLIGRYLRKNNLLPDIAYASPLLRTRETAEIALLESNANARIEFLESLSEIDYGPDEDKTEDEVIARIGRQAIEDWDVSARVPPGWIADPEGIASGWKALADRILETQASRGGAWVTALAVTSNGIARFLPRILAPEAFDNFLARYKLKIATGALCILEHERGEWDVKAWNTRP